MRLGRPGRIALALVAVVGAAGLALIARAAFAVERDFAATDARLELPVSRQPDGQTHGLAYRATETLLGTGADRSFRDAVALFRKSEAPGLRPEQRLRLRALAERSLRSQHARAPARSRAENLLGVLEFEDARSDPTGAGEDIQASIDAFAQAARTDPANDDAKFNLELLYTLSSNRKVPKPQPKTGRSHGAGGSPGTIGY
ncbi:MAG TPA: hypothetical protein VGF23_07905 [Gaiellaceae bacterium]